MSDIQLFDYIYVKYIVMSRINQLASLKAHLQKRYSRLVEKSASYKYLDEEESDLAAYKALMIEKKLRLMNYFEMDSL